ncbi:hypothetical protein [Paucisalibacillus globulus]|uniref:hypothetical protein n=1 Tax=Paucisalibacillus globulus TaxID=351095 RepID=UPI0003F528B7|nr:hypothetical protein [Paucisalibacillus globulus]
MIKRLSLIITAMLLVLMISACGTSSEKKEDADAKEEKGGSEAVEVEEEQKENDVPFSIGDFVVEINPNGNIDSAGGVEFAFTIQNNSSIPIQEFSADVNFEFENGQKMTDTVEVYTTILDGEAVGNSAVTIYPEPASQIKSYDVIAYQVLDENGIYYDVDLQVETISFSDYGMWDVSDETSFDVEDFTVVITPNGNIDSAGGVEYSYEIQNNSEIPVQEISFDVLMEFENGIKQVETISIYNTLMNGDVVGDSGITAYPEPAAKIKSYKIIGYQITDKDNIYYDVDSQLGIVEAYEYE